MHRVCRISTKPKALPPVCSMCHRTFKSKGNLKNHLKLCQTAFETAKCPVCGKTFQRSVTKTVGRKLKWHLLSAHVPRSDKKVTLGNTYECKGCDQHFINYRLFVKHQAHSECKSKVFNCSKCLINFPNRSWLGRHKCHKFNLQL